MRNNEELKGAISFSELIERYCIKIPIIQRDYAQGRDSANEIRDKFLDALYDSLFDKEKALKLDFIYGTIENGYFIPLDGQQRLTTLFLLYWYLAKIECIEFNLKDKFSYETRTSSREFCNKLISEKFEINDNKISKAIENQNWYYMEWNHDPTIKSMLKMLDTIEEKFKNHANYNNSTSYFDKLKNITFQFLILEKFKLTDDLYIKMNARGKLLTPFENFKAEFEKYIKENEQEFDKSKSEKFVNNIDRDWADLFWNYKDISNSDTNKSNTYDDEMMNFIRVIFGFGFHGKDEFKEESLKVIFDQEQYKNLSFSKYKNIGCINKETFEMLYHSFDNLINDEHKLLNIIDSKYKPYYEEEIFFKKVLKGNISYPERILFYAYIKYLIYRYNREDINQWMRVFHNLTENSEIDSIDRYLNALKLIDKILEKKKKVISCSF